MRVRLLTFRGLGCDVRRSPHTAERVDGYRSTDENPCESPPLDCPLKDTREVLQDENLQPQSSYRLDPVCTNHSDEVVNHMDHEGRDGHDIYHQRGAVAATGLDNHIQQARDLEIHRTPLHMGLVACRCILCWIPGTENGVADLYGVASKIPKVQTSEKP